MNEVAKFQFLNVSIDNVEFQEFIEKLDSGLVVTPNVDHLIKLQKDRRFYDAYQAADHVVCDSRILMKLSRFLDKENPIKAQIAGSDLFPAYCDFHKSNTENVRIFLLGGTPDTVKSAQNKINEKTNSQIIVKGYSPPFGFEKDDREQEKIVELVNQSKATVLAMGVGAPKQENWLAENRHRFNQVHTFFAIGATIEFEAGGLSRAPKWMTKFGLEWMYRLFQEPKRMFKRYIIEDSAIFLLCLKQKFGLYRNPFSK